MSREGALMASDRTGVGALADELVCHAHELVAEGWCQGAAATDEYGRPIEPASAWARRWSAAGALERGWRRSPHDPDTALAAFQLASLALAAVVKEAPQAWNDRRGRHVSEVLDALAEAALLLGDPDEVETLAAVAERSAARLGPSPDGPASEAAPLGAAEPR